MSPGVGQRGVVPPYNIGYISFPLAFSILVREGLGARADTCRYQRFSMVYTPCGSVSPSDGSIHSLIAFAASSTCLQKSTIRYRWMALVGTLSTLRLWRGLWQRAARISIIPMDLGDVQRGWEGCFRVGCTGSKFLMVCNCMSAPLSSAAGGGWGLSRNYLLPRRYRAWHRVGCCNSLSQIAKWSDMYLRMSLIPTSSKRRRSVPRM